MNLKSITGFVITLFSALVFCSSVFAKGVCRLDMGEFSVSANLIVPHDNFSQKILTPTLSLRTKIIKTGKWFDVSRWAECFEKGIKASPRSLLSFVKWHYRGETFRDLNRHGRVDYATNIRYPAIVHTLLNRLPCAVYLTDADDKPIQTREFTKDYNEVLFNSEKYSDQLDGEISDDSEQEKNHSVPLHRNDGDEVTKSSDNSINIKVVSFEKTIVYGFTDHAIAQCKNFAEQKLVDAYNSNVENVTIDEAKAHWVVDNANWPLKNSASQIHLTEALIRKFSSVAKK